MVIILSVIYFNISNKMNGLKETILQAIFKNFFIQSVLKLFKLLFVKLFVTLKNKSQILLSVFDNFWQILLRIMFNSISK